MCCEDRKIGEGLNPVATTVPAETTSAVLVAANPNRDVLILNSALTGTVTYSPETTVVSGVGINIPATERPVVLTRSTHGNIVAAEWSLIHSAGSVSVLLIQGIRSNDPCK